MGLRVEAIAEVVAHPVLEGQEAGEHRDVGGQGQGDVGVRVLEEDRLLAEAVEVRGLHARVAVGRQVVGAQGVDGDEDDGRARELRRPGRARSRRARRG